MSKIIALEILEAEAASLVSALDKALAALRGTNHAADEECEERILRLRVETHLLLEQIRVGLR